MRTALALVLASALAAPAWADIVHLKDGRKIEGKVTDLGERIKIERKIGSILVNKEDVLRIEPKEFVDAPVPSLPPPPPAAPPSTPAALPGSSPAPLAALRPRPPLRLTNSLVSLDGSYVLYHPPSWGGVAGTDYLPGPRGSGAGVMIQLAVSASEAPLPELAEAAKKEVLKGAAPTAACVGWEYFVAGGKPAVQLEFEAPFELRKLRTLVQVAKSDRTVVTLRFAEEGSVFDKHWYEASRIMRSIRFFSRKGELSPVQKKLFVDAWERGQVQLKAAQGETAARAFRDCLEIVPDLAVAQGALARAYLVQGEHRSAVVSCQLGLRIEPDNVLLNWLLAYSYVLWGKEDDAAQALKKTMAADPENDEAFFYAGLLLAEKGKWSDAKDAWLKGTGSCPDSGRLLYALGFALEKLGRRTEAAEAYRRCLATDPNVAEAKQRLAALQK